jgi:exonuclease SbcC
MIDELQTRAQEYLSAYSTVLQVSFDTQRETKSGTVKDEFHIIVTDGNGVEIPYEIYSSGQRVKVRLAVTRALASMIGDQCGKDFNFAAFDEPNDSLDDVGKEANFTTFEELARSGKVVLCTDHDSTFKDRFDATITVVLENDRSFIVEN